MKFLDIGRVIGLHGVRGKVKVAAFSGIPRGVLAAKTLRLSGGRGTAPGAVGDYEVVTAQRAGGCAVFSLKGIDTIEAAETLVTAVVSVRYEAPPPRRRVLLDRRGRLPRGGRGGSEVGRGGGGGTRGGLRLLVVRRPGGRTGTSPWWPPSFARSTRRRGGWSPLRPRGGDVRIDVLTLFPGMFPGPLSHSILGRAGEAGLLAVFVHDLRPYAEGKHRVTDEPPFGGGGGMVMKPEPIFAGVEALRAAHGPGRVILLSPAGSLLTPEASPRGWRRRII